jgi:hypothetical protein
MNQADITSSPEWQASMGLIPPYIDGQGQRFAPQSIASDRFMTDMCQRFKDSSNPEIKTGCACFREEEKQKAEFPDLTKV